VPNPIQIRRTLTPNSPPPNNSLAVGECGIELAGPNPRLWVGVPTSIDPTGRRLIADVTRAYVDGQFAAAGSGTVTRVETGVGLVGGPITTSGEIALIVPLAVELGGSGADSLAAAPWLLKAGGQLTGPLLVWGPPADDQEVVSKLYVDNLVEASAGGVRRITAGTGLTGGTITGTGTIALEVPVPVTRGGTGAVTLADARTVLGIAVAPTLAAGVGLALDTTTVLGVTTATIGLTVPVAVANGGTGATSAAGARSALGVPALPLTVADGGTGANNAADARTNLGLPDDLGVVPVSFTFHRKYEAGQVINVPITRPLTVPAVLAGTRYYAAVGPQAQRIFTIRRMRGGTATSFGTLTIAASAIDVAALAGPGGDLAAGDALQVQAPSPADPDLEDFGITVVCNRA
jgi:Zn-dependent protease